MKTWIVKICILGLVSLMNSKPSHAEPIQVHKTQMQEIAKKIIEYQIRLEELKEKKESTPEGPQLEEVLSEIADMHRELVVVKKRRETLREHLRHVHSKEEVVSDLSFFKQTEKRKDEKPDEEVDRKLDQLLKLVQTQYARTLSEDFKVSQELQTEQDVRRKLKEQRVKVHKADKKRYIREGIDTTIKAE